MTGQGAHWLLTLALLGGLAGCAQESPEISSADFTPDYLGVDTRLLDESLVSFLVEMRGARGRDDIAAYAECAAAQYTLIRGYGFARHLRTKIDEEAGIWRADAVYTISPVLPRGAHIINAKAKVKECANNGIPTV